MKFFNAKRIGIFLAILIGSLIFGAIFDAVMTAKEKKNYPMDPRYAEYVTAASGEFGIPEAAIWAVCREESGFSSGLRSADGKIGLMQISPEIFTFVSTKLLETSYETGMLYDPATNLRVGTAYLAYLYERYGVWKTVFAAYTAGTEQVDTWLGNKK